MLAAIRARTSCEEVNRARAAHSSFVVGRPLRCGRSVGIGPGARYRPCERQDSGRRCVISTRSALAVRDGKVLALGTDEEIRKLAGRTTRTIDLQGRTVIPGPIDSHMHATRAALSFSTEVNWIGATTLAEALGRLRDAAHRARPGAWLIVVTPPATLEAYKGGAVPRRRSSSPPRPTILCTAARLWMGNADASRAEGVEHHH